jgi:hypothetical protein
MDCRSGTSASFGSAIALSKALECQARSRHPLSKARMSTQGPFGLRDPYNLRTRSVMLPAGVLFAIVLPASV